MKYSVPRCDNCFVCALVCVQIQFLPLLSYPVLISLDVFFNSSQNCFHMIVLFFLRWFFCITVLINSISSVDDESVPLSVVVLNLTMTLTQPCMDTLTMMTNYYLSELVNHCSRSRRCCCCYYYYSFVAMLLLSFR
jgi:hypothetical protein